MGTSAPRTFGIEEEFVLLDAETLSTADAAASAVTDLAPRHARNVGHEFYASQLEYSSPVFDAIAPARARMGRFRADLAAWARDHGVVAVSAGTPFRVSAVGRRHADPRYDRIADDIGTLADEHQINGLHVHVEISDAADGVRASNALRPWLPVLLALSANSPYWHGRDTGFASWRALHGRRWTTHGIPPAFADEAAYRRTVSALGGVGTTSDEGTVNWNVRLSAHYPTVEIRVCDGQLDLESTLALAALIRAIVQSAGDGAPPVEPAPGLWEAALWHAARHGVAGALVDPVTAALAPARAAVASLRCHVTAALAAAGDTEVVDAFLFRVLRDGPGATAQWRAGRMGVTALAALYRSRLA